MKDSNLGLAFGGGRKQRNYNRIRLSTPGASHKVG